MQTAALPAEPLLAAYVVADNESSLGVHELQEFVQRKLPDYMVPSAFVLLNALPLTANGKIDRQALPEPRFKGSIDNLCEPRTPTEVALADIWSEVLAVPTVGLNDNFFDLGGHSLLAARLMGRIKNELSIELPLRVLFEGPTIAQLSPKVQTKKQESIFHLREQGNYQYLFELQRGDSGKAVFCFPFRGGLNGEFFNFIRLTRYFGSHYSFYGVLARGLDGVSEPRRSIPEMAADYLKEIRAVQPQGPYIFVGECQGGFVAYEAARQMMAHGGEMGLLVLLDSPAGLPSRDRWRRSLVPIKYHLGKSPAWKYLRTRYKYHLRTIRQQSAAAALSYAVKKVSHAFSTIPYLVDLEHSERFAGDASDNGAVELRLESLRRAFDVAVRRYILKRYPGRVALLVNERAYSENRYRDWFNYIGENLEVYKLSGDHDTCVPQNIPLVAQILKECLASLEKKPDNARRVTAS
jgi:thioesterase domain-containing protein/acyl carrier protein